MKTRLSFYVTAVVLFAALVAAAGCSKAPNDAQITSDIQSKLNNDSGLQGKQLGVQSEGGTVTLSGTVDNDAEREAASRYAASAPGVKQVLNNLQVAQAPAPQPDQTVQEQPEESPQPAPARAKRHISKRPASNKHHVRETAYSNTHRASVWKPQPHTAPAHSPDPVYVAQQSTSAPAPVPVQATPPPPPPAPQKVTIPTGTSMSIRLVDAIDSETAQPGQTFHATLDSPLAVDGDIAVPAGYDVEGHIVAVQSAGKFQGKSLLTLQLDRITVGSMIHSIQTDQYHREGSSRGKNTAEKVGAGAVIGAIIGGIAGGGKGAGIGAAAGGGIGGGVQAATKGQQIKLPSETVLNFTLQAPVSVIPTSKRPHSGRPRLENNQNKNQDQKQDQDQQ